MFIYRCDILLPPYRSRKKVDSIQTLLFLIKQFCPLICLTISKQSLLEYIILSQALVSDLLFLLLTTKPHNSDHGKTLALQLPPGILIRMFGFLDECTAVSALSRMSGSFKTFGSWILSQSRIKVLAHESVVSSNFQYPSDPVWSSIPWTADCTVCSKRFSSARETFLETNKLKSNK